MDIVSIVFLALLICLPLLFYKTLKKGIKNRVARILAAVLIGAVLTVLLFGLLFS